jgi:hypothetical protein
VEAPRLLHAWHAAVDRQPAPPAPVHAADKHATIAAMSLPFTAERRPLPRQKDPRPYPEEPRTDVASGGNRYSVTSC